jgi:hypothetical protein
VDITTTNENSIPNAIVMSTIFNENVMFTIPNENVMSVILNANITSIYCLDGTKKVTVEIS